MATKVKRTIHIPVGKIVKATMKSGTLAVAMAGASEAKNRAPTDITKLKGSINARSESDTTAIYGPNVDYGIYLEFGTGKFAEKGGRKTPWVYFSEKLQRFVRTEGQPAQPYLRPSADWLKSRAGDIYAKVLKRAL